MAQPPATVENGDGQSCFEMVADGGLTFAPVLSGARRLNALNNHLVSERRLSDERVSVLTEALSTGVIGHRKDIVEALMEHVERFGPGAAVEPPPPPQTRGDW